MHQITSQNQQPDNSEILPAHPYVKYLPEPTSALKELVSHDHKSHPARKGTGQENFLPGYQCSPER